MKVKVKVSCLVILFFTFVPDYVKSENLRVNQNERNSFTEVMANALKSQSWDGDERPCLDAFITILDNARNSTLWAVWVLDSIQLPIGQLFGQRYHVGNYDECLKPHYGFRVSPLTPKTQYCVTHVTFVDVEEKARPVERVPIEHNVTVEEYMKKHTKHGRIFSHLGWGICVPEVCRPSAVVKVARVLLRNSHLESLADSATIAVKHCKSEILEETSQGTLFKLLVLFLAIVAIVCTYCVKSGRATPGTFVGELSNAFNLSRNMNTITEVRDGEVASMNLMRVVSCLLVIIVHYILVAYCHFLVNGLDQEHFHDIMGDTSSHIDIMVDTFLALSGILYMRGLFSDKAQNPLKILWKRYIRLAAALAAVILYMSIGHHGDGPLWESFMTREVNICRDNWLGNLLMMGNVMKCNSLCVLIAWYVPCDFQLCVFATLLYMIYKRDSTIGKLAFAISFVMSLVIPLLVMYYHDMTPILFDGIESMVHIRHTKEFNYFYIQSYCRGGPFLLGSVLGYIMYRFKPKDHRKIISTFTSYLAVLASVVLMYQMLALGNYFYVRGRSMTAMVYAAVNRTLWGLGVCVVIGATEYGNVPFLDKMFSWYPLVPLSRLTYGVYLTHFALLELIFCTGRAMFSFDIFSMGMGMAGVAAYGFVASLVVWLLFEAPVININNMLIDRKWRNKTEEVRLNTTQEEKKLS